MPVSGNEETGVKPISKQASDYIAGVPIKKRRFPKLCLSPPPSEEPTSFAAENNSLKEQSDSLQKEQSDSLQEEQSESLQKEQSDLLQKEQPNSQQKEQPNSQQKEESNSQQKEQSNSLQKEQSNSLQKEQSNSLQSDSLQSASAATCYSGISDAHKKAVSEEPKESSDHIHVTLFQNVPNYSRVKLKEPRLRIQSGSVGNVDGNDKLVAAKNSELPITLAKTKLKVAPNEALVLTMGKETCSNEKSEGKYLSKKSEGKCKAEIPTIPGNIELTLGLKEHLFPALAGQNGDGMGQKKNSLEPGSLNLSLSNANSSIQRKKDDVESNDDVHLCANRANWDLNVLMDAWQCSASDSAADQVSVDDFNPTDHAQDIKPFICSTGMIGTASSAEHNSVSENRANFDISSKLSGQQNEIVDPLHLGLSPTSFQSQVSQEPSCLSAKEDFVRVFPNMSLPRLEASTSNLDRVNHRTVKSEPFDESIKLDNIGTKGYSMGLLNSRTLKHELVDCSLAKSSNISSLNLGVPESIKTEPVHEDRQALNMIEGTSRVDKQVLQGLSNHSIAMPSPRTAPTACTAVESSCSTELITAGDVAKNFEHSRCTEGAHSNVEVVPQEACESTQLVASETVDTAVGHNGKESNTSVMIDIVRAQDGISDNPEQCRLQCMNDHLPDMRVSEDSVSDEEKIEISADMLEDSYSSDYESDGNHPLDRAMGTKQDGEEDDYEDGEVREPLMDNAVEEPICDNEAEHVDHGDSDNRKMDIIVQDGDYHATLSHGEVKDLTEDPDETNNKDNNHNDDRVEGVSSSSADKLTCLQESLTVEKLTGAGMKRPISDIQGKPGDQSGSKDCLKEQEKESSSEKTSGGNQEAVATVDENVKKILMLEKNDTALPKMEASADGDDVAKDVNNCGIRSRIINLSRASHLLSPGKTRPISARSLPSRAGREMPDAVLEGEDLHPQGRDELYMDGSHKFSRERHQDNSPRNSRLNFMRGRGRITSRLDTLHGDWDSDHDFNSGFYNGTTEFRVPRHKYASAVPDADLEYNSYNIAPEGSFFGTGRGRRKHLNDDIFRRIPSRRQSSGGRDIPAACGGGQMIHRVTRNVSPGRCVDEDGSEMVGPRRSEKFVRVFTDDTMEPMFTRPQPAYEGVGGHFARGTRNFPSVQRRGLPRIHSKSPIRSRSRSPGPWPSRRSQDGFGGPPELIHQRSPPIYRMERMRSPDRPCFTGDLIVRRHGSPPYLSRSSNDLRDMDSGRDNGHPRSVIPNRSQSGRILLRNRQFDAINPREKTGNDEYFGGPMNTGRLHELSGDANGDDRRRYGGRRGPVRSFRPPYNDANGEGFHLNSEDGPRPFRFYPEDDSEFHQRGNLRGRGFDRRIKNQPGNAHRRTRSIEEQEVNYRRGGQVWQDDGFDEISRVKRKRF